MGPHIASLFSSPKNCELLPSSLQRGCRVVVLGPRGSGAVPRGSGALEGAYDPVVERGHWPVAGNHAQNTVNAMDFDCSDIHEIQPLKIICQVVHDPDFQKPKPGWWFDTFFLFPSIWNNQSSQVTFIIFFRGVGFNHQHPPTWYM